MSTKRARGQIISYVLSTFSSYSANGSLMTCARVGLWSAESGGREGEVEG
jgi:hypothetical protein